MVGWQPAVTDEMISGTVGQNHPIEAIKASVTNKTGVAGSLQYSSHVSWIGWQEWKTPMRYQAQRANLNQSKQFASC